MAFEVTTVAPQYIRPEENWRGLKEIWVPMELLARFLGRINLPFVFYLFIYFFQTRSSLSNQFELFNFLCFSPGMGPMG